MQKIYYFLVSMLLGLAVYNSNAAPGEKISVFISAHQDDWQLFMGRDFYNQAIAPKNKIILIVTTSGGIDQHQIAVRDSGTIASVQYVTSAQPGPLVYKKGLLLIENHRLPYYSFNNITVIFFHLPDGNTDGKGFKESQYQSLTKLKNGAVKNVRTSDSLNIFQNWQVLSGIFEKTLKSQIKVQPCEIYLHLPDTSVSFNPNDHPDHIASAELALNAFAKMKPHYRFYSQYQNEFRAANLTGKDSIHQTGLFQAYDATATKGMGFCTTCYTDLYQKWCVRNYSRTVD